jgi:hypothetical protein
MSTGDFSLSSVYGYTMQNNNLQAGLVFGKMQA